MKHAYAVAALAALGTLAGCTSTPKAPPVFSEAFITNITEQGNRMFTYTAKVNTGDRQRRPSGPADGRRGGKGGGKGGVKGGMSGGGMGGPSSGMQQQGRGNPEKAARERLEEILAETHYCPHGWFVIEQTDLQGSVEVRGECRAR
ncbi:hypothetical protein [Microbulbifer agarilyticus]|uniref:hypothetical protein n=1 Tax=Microbulbifer agarilyticus TaxID=260552 RepID=UPI001CD2213D|nr:hypothetical protein [Microbulbifer agarilyticus]MCA0892815.1 hypothetical protein [Microbulbifer agarilyticus]